MKLIKKKIKDNKHIIGSDGKSLRLAKTYYYEHFYETEEFYIVSYKILPTAGLEYMIIRKDDNITIKQGIQEIKTAKKIIGLLEQI